MKKGLNRWPPVKICGLIICIIGCIVGIRYGILLYKSTADTGPAIIGMAICTASVALGIFLIEKIRHHYAK